MLVSGYNVMYPGSAEIVLEFVAQLGEDVVVAFDPSNRVTDIPEANLICVLERADWTLCNETEASLLTGEHSLVASVTALATRTGRRGVVVRHGASGCTVLVKNGAPVHVDGFEVAVRRHQRRGRYALRGLPRGAGDGHRRARSGPSR